MARFAGVILVDRRGWILLQERDEHPVLDPDKWGLVGGHVDEGEDFEPAAYRELEEETELVLAPPALRFWRMFVIYHDAYESRDTMQVFVSAVDLGDDDITCHEGRQIVFVEPHRARLLDLTESASDVVPAFLESADYRALVGRSND